MTLRLLIDMNLSPDWVAVFDSAGIEAGHWSRIGDPRAADRVLLRWARQRLCGLYARPGFWRPPGKFRRRETERHSTAHPELAARSRSGSYPNCLAILSCRAGGRRPDHGGPASGARAHLASQMRAFSSRDPQSPGCAVREAACWWHRRARPSAGRSPAGSSGRAPHRARSCSRSAT